MSQINVNPPSEDRGSSAGLVTALIVLIILIALGWFFMAGPGRGAFSGASTNNNAPAQVAPAGGSNGGASGNAAGGVSGSAGGVSGGASGSASGSAGGSSSSSSSTGGTGGTGGNTGGSGSP
ncbi:MAG: hypothetical protein U0822_21805 [Anaerolineae bacterium]